MSPSPPLADIRASHAPAVVILGNDAILAARPATPVQLAHACLAAGFRAAIPGSWGDELVAEATLTALSTRTTRPAIHCACPHVARRVLAVGSDLAPHLVSLVAPPVAAARYLRLHSGDELRVTYVGRCPAAADDAIDARLTPEELLAQFADRGIDVTTQPEVFESVIPPDRRRHLSVPGGVPAPDVLWERAGCKIATMNGSDFAAQLADLVLGSTDTLIDPAAMVGCACTGAVRGESAGARDAVTTLEPPRSARPIVEEGDALHLELQLPVAARSAIDLVIDPSAPPARSEHRMLDGPVLALGDAPPSPPPTPNRRPRLTPPGIAAITAPIAASPGSSVPPRRRSPVGIPRVVPGAVPFASDSEGRILPRAYAARRRSPRSGVPAVIEPVASPVVVQPAAAVTAPAPEPSPPPSPVPASSQLAAPPAIATPPVNTERKQQASAPLAPVSHMALTPAAVPVSSEPVRQTRPVAEDDSARTRRDSERPVVRSVEPGSARATAATALAAESVAARPAMPPPAVRQDRAGANAEAAPWASRIGLATAAVRRNPRAVIAVVLAAAGVLLGVAIGYSAGRRDTDPSRAAAAPADQGGSSSRDTAMPRSSGARESVSAGGLAPTPGVTRRSATRPPPRSTPPRLRRGSAGSTVRDGVAATEPTSPAVPPSTPAPAVPDSAAVRAQRDSVTRVEAINSEREQIRREIDRRRARVDSIERARFRLDSLRRADQAGARPPRR